VSAASSRSSRPPWSALALCESLDIRVWASILASDLGFAYVFLLRVPEAPPLLERAATGGGSDASGRLARLGVGYLHAGQADRALAMAHRALAVATGAGERGSEADALRILGDILSQGDRLDTAEAASHYGRALGLAGPLGMRPLVAHCHLGLGKLYRRAGTQQHAREHLAAAAAMYREMGMRFYSEQADAG
jgi:tetratricopeptide (TPR) repeat protein